MRRMRITLVRDSDLAPLGKLIKSFLDQEEVRQFQNAWEAFPDQLREHLPPSLEELKSSINKLEKIFNDVYAMAHHECAVPQFRGRLLDSRFPWMYTTPLRKHVEKMFKLLQPYESPLQRQLRIAVSELNEVLGRIWDENSELWERMSNEEQEDIICNGYQVAKHLQQKEKE